MMAMIPALVLALTAIAAGLDVACDVTILGGSASSLAAGLAAAQAAPELTVCLTDPTDWYALLPVSDSCAQGQHTGLAVS